MKLKAEELKAGMVISHKGGSYKIQSALKRFYKNGRAKMEVKASQLVKDNKLGTGAVENFIFKADTKIEIYVPEMR